MTCGPGSDPRLEDKKVNLEAFGRTRVGWVHGTWEEVLILNSLSPVRDSLLHLHCII